MPSLAAVQVVGDALAVVSCPEEKKDLSASLVMDGTTRPDHEAPQAQASTDPVATSVARKRRNTVTPNTPTNSSKKKQQSTVGQRTLASFFFPTSSDKAKRARTETTEDNGTALNQVESASSPTPFTHADKTQEASEPKKRRIKTSITKSVGKSGNCVVGPLDSETSPLEKDKMGKSVGHCDNGNVHLHDLAQKNHEGAQSISDNDLPEGTKVMLDSESSNDGGSSSKRVIDSQAESKVKDLSSEVGTKPSDIGIPQRLFHADRSKEDRSAEKIGVGKLPQVEPQKESTQSLPDLPDERLTLLRKHKHMEESYSKLAEALVVGARGGLDEENFEMPEPQHAVVDASADSEFPACVIANMVLHIEGSQLSLSKLTTKLRKQLEECHSIAWTHESITTKIKLLAKRKSYLETSASVDLFEDDTADRMWRWEVVSIELLPEGITSKIKKARAARKKLLSHYSATVKLVSALQDAEKLVLDKSLPNLDTVLAKISQNEEKVLKFEREAEKQRLTEQAMKMKAQELISKKEEKEVAEKEKRLEKERKKEEATKAREEAKRQKEEEKEVQKRLELEKLDQKQARLKKQRDCMKSFFTANTKQANQKPDIAIPKEDHTADAPEIKGSVDSREVFDFRTVLNSEPGAIANRPFARLSSQARESRKRRVQQVPVSVYVTVIPDNCFDAQPFAERTVVQVRNKYRFLSFHEDCRPPYHGTWSKTSSVITGRHPFAKDDADLDYEIDSEGEWEEGDDEIGEDVDDDEKNKDEEVDEEEGDCREYNYEDGFCVADQDYLAIDEDADEETKMLYKKKFQNIEKEPQQNASVPNRLCIVAPLFGGIPLSKQVEGHADFIEGLNVQEATDLLESHRGITFLDVDLCLDAFPPPIVDEADAAPDISASTQKDEYSTEDMKTLAHFVHHCTLNSKEKVIEELRNQYASVFSSRAKATRKLDSIAIKRRRDTTNGVYWEVKKEILEELGLKGLLAKTLETAVEAEKTIAEPVAVQGKEEAPSSTVAPTPKTVKKRSRQAPSSSVAPAPKKEKKRARLESQIVESGAKKNIQQDNEGVIGSSKKKKEAALVLSANLMANFLKKAKMDDTKPKEGKSDTGPAGSIE